MIEKEFNILDERNARPAEIFNVINLGLGHNYKRTGKDNETSLTYVEHVNGIPSSILRIENDFATEDSVYLKILSEERKMKKTIKMVESQIPQDFYLEEVVKEKTN